MTIEERVEKKEYLYKVENCELVYGRQYNINKCKFNNYAYNTLLPMLFNEYIRENKEKVIEGIVDNTGVVYMDIDAQFDEEIIDYIQRVFHDFFILRAIKNKDK